MRVDGSLAKGEWRWPNPIRSDPIERPLDPCETMRSQIVHSLSPTS